MPEATELVNLIRKIALDTVSQSKPMEIVYGTVLSVSPIRIKRDQKATLGKEHLVQTSFLRDNIAVGDVVVLLKVQGGQSYLVIDKVVK